MRSVVTPDLLHLWLNASVEELRKHRAELNALNVFPVPDGDTGTNLYLTMASAVSAVNTSTAASVADILSVVALGARRGARGNSGVILASALQAMADVAQEHSDLTIAQLLKASARAARKSVAEPQEGTALTVLDAAASAETSSPRELADRARSALERTREMLPSLKAAGVVDAGGRGVVILLDVMVAVWTGRAVASPPVGHIPMSVPSSCIVDAEFEVMCQIAVEAESVVLPILSKSGSSVTLSHGPENILIHVHCDEPLKLIQEIESHTPCRTLVVEHLRSPGRTRAAVAHLYGSGTVCLAAAADVVIVGAEPEQRPSVSDFVNAALRSNADEVLLFASDADSVVVAQTAQADLLSMNVLARVVPTTSLVETLLALTEYSENGSLDEIARLCSATGQSVRSIGISQADRSAQTALGLIERGEYLAVNDHQVIAKSQTVIDALRQALSTLPVPEIITVLTGFGYSDDAVVDVETALTEMFPSIHIDVIRGNQRMWQLMVGCQ